jgi:pimeloyl-ACP methyl ester carboxylesterase
MSVSSTHPLFTTSSGPTGAPAIVFLHGGGSGGWMWQEVIKYLPDYHCLMPDLPEHGQSRSVGPFSMLLAAEKTAALIRNQVPAGKAVVVGLSEGAQVTVQLLASSPELVERAVISSALLRPIPGTGWMANRNLLQWTHRLTVQPFKNSEMWIRLNMKHAAGIPEQYYVQFKKDFQEMDEKAFANLMLANQRFRLPVGLEHANCPTLIVVGEKEYSAMRKSARDLADSLPNARAMKLNLGSKATLAMEHNWALTTPDLFASTVQAWIKGNDLPKALSDL